MAEREDTLCTSAFTVGEVLTGPYKLGNTETASRIRGAFLSPQIELISFTPDTADHYARIRGTHRVSGERRHVRVDLFLTNDHTLRAMIIPGIQLIAGMDVNVF